MSKIFVPLPSMKNIPLYLQQNFDGFLMGIDGFSSNFNSYVKKEEIKEYLDIVNKYNIDIYICLNKLFYNSEIDLVRELLLEIKDYDFSGIFYTDVGVLNILNDINFDKDILWYSNHLGTNSKTLDFLAKRGVSSALLSNEISVDEIKSIISNTNIKVGCTLYGFLNMATSSRKLLTNYFEHIDKKKEKEKYFIKDKVKEGTYFLVENKDTNFFTNLVLNGIKFFPELIESGIDFVFLDDYMLNENNFYNVIEAFSSLRQAHDDKDFVDKLEKVVDVNTYYDTFYGFLDKKTVYKVEDYGKN